MIGSLVIVLASACLAFLATYMFFKLGENTGSQHFILQLLMIAIIISSVSIMGVAGLDASRECSWQTSYIETMGGDQELQYDYVCLDEPSNVAETFLYVTTWFYRLFILYMFFYILFAVLGYFGKLPKNMRKKDL